MFGDAQETTFLQYCFKHSVVSLSSSHHPLNEQPTKKKAEVAKKTKMFGFADLTSSQLEKLRRAITAPAPTGFFLFPVSSIFFICQLPEKVILTGLSQKEKETKLQIAQAMARLAHGLNESQLATVYLYWRFKRKFRPSPLLRRFQVLVYYLLLLLLFMIWLLTAK